MHLSNMAICLMDSDKAIGGLYLDADDFLHTASSVAGRAACHGKRGESSLLFFFFYWLQSITVSVCLCVRQTDRLPVYPSSQPPLAGSISPFTWYKFSINAARRVQTISQLDCSLCIKAQSCTWSRLS